MKKNIYFLILFIFLVANTYAQRNKNKSNTENVNLRLSPSSFDEKLLKEDPFENAEFVKGVKISGVTLLNSSYRNTKTTLGKTGSFDMNQIAFVNMNGRITRTLNFGFSTFFSSNFLGHDDNYADVEDQTINGRVSTGARGGSVELQQRTKILDFTFGLSSGIIYYAGVLTYSNTNVNLQNQNFRRPPFLQRTTQGFATYEREFNQSALSGESDAEYNLFNFNFAKGFKLLVQTKRSKINSFSFAGITPANTRLNAWSQRNSTTFFNRTSKLFQVNALGQRAKYELALSNQVITGVDDFVNGTPINYYIHSFTLGRRTGPIGFPLSTEALQPDYEIAYMRTVTPNNQGIGDQHTDVAKGIILKHAIMGKVFGVNPLMLRLNMYHVDSGYVNPNAGHLNTSPTPFRINETLSFPIYLANDRMLSIDGVANNRQGINFQYGYQFNNIFSKQDALRITGGNEVSRQLVRSTRPFIQSPYGPTITRSDIDITGRPTEKLYFSAFEADAKYLGKIFKREVYIQSYFLSYTTKTSFHWTPDFTNKSTVRSHQYNIGCFYHLFEGVVPYINFNYYRVRGNINTVLNAPSTSDNTPVYSPQDVVNKTLSFGINAHLNRDYLLSINYSFNQNKDLSNLDSKSTSSNINFTLIYNFRAT